MMFRGWRLIGRFYFKLYACWWNLTLACFYSYRRWNLRNNRSQRDKEYRKNLLAEIMTFEEQAVNIFFLFSLMQYYWLHIIIGRKVFNYRNSLKLLDDISLDILKNKFELNPDDIIRIFLLTIQSWLVFVVARLFSFLEVERVSLQ